MFGVGSLCTTFHADNSWEDISRYRKSVQLFDDDDTALYDDDELLLDDSANQIYDDDDVVLYGTDSLIYTV